MPNEDKWAKKNWGCEKCVSPKSLPVKYKEHEKGESSMSWEEEVVFGIIEHIIEEEPNIVILQDDLVWMNTKMGEGDKKGSDSDKKCNRLDRKEDILWFRESEENGD